MRIYQRVLFVTALTIVLSAAGVGLVRSYLSPLAEQAAARPESADEMGDDLPSACLDELAALENLAGKHDRASPATGLASVSKSEQDSALATETHVVDANFDHTKPFAPSPSHIQPAQQPPSDSDAAARPIRSFNSAGTARSMFAATAIPTSGILAAANVPARPEHTATLPVSVEEPLPSEALDSLRAVDVLDLMRQLRAEADASRNSARRELLRRGFSEVDLELARQLFSPDVAARKQLALAVPRLASVDAARWLLWLAADPQPEVRIAAITTLATTGDPALLDRVESLARKDSDPQVQAIADQIARQHDLSISRGAANPLR